MGVGGWGGRRYSRICHTFTTSINPSSKKQLFRIFAAIVLVSTVLTGMVVNRNLNLAKTENNWHFGSFLNLRNLNLYFGIVATRRICYKYLSVWKVAFIEPLAIWVKSLF